MPYYFKGFFEISEDRVQILLILEVLSHRFLRLIIYYVVHPPALSLYRSLVIISSAYGLRVGRKTLRN